MPAMNYKEATGVRARTDLSANTRPGQHYGMTDADLLKVEAHLSAQAQAGTPYTLYPSLSGRLADAILEVLNRRGVVP